jgi:Ca2+-transporting ATPase
MPPFTQSQLSNLKSTADVEALGGIVGIARGLGSDLKTGLSPAAIEASRAAYGENRLPPKSVKSFWEHLLEALGDDTLRILIFSAVVSMAFGVFLSPPESRTADITQAVAIVVAIMAVSLVNSYQNWSKDGEFQSLERIKADREVTVVRGGAESALSVYELVVGDVVRLEGGAALPCDGLLARGSDVSVDESALTGESMPALKGADAGEDCVLSGSTLLAEGEGYMLATAVGAASRVGALVKTLEEQEVGETHLQEQLTALAAQIGNAGTAAGVLTFAVLSALWALRADPAKSLMDLIQYAIIGISIVVVAVPEGLPLAVTISLAFSMKRMMADKNLVRQLQACETMGSVTVVASDKTGTLTQNRMEVVEAFAFNAHYASAAALGAALAAHPGAQRRLGAALALNSTAELLGGGADGEPTRYLRSPTEGALLLLARRHLGGLDYAAERAAATQLARRPFNKATKFMATAAAAPARDGGGAAIYVTGAPEVLLERVVEVQQLDSSMAPAAPEVRCALLAAVDTMAVKGLRVVAVAYRRVPAAAAAGPRDALLALGDGGLTLLGLFGIADPLREGVAGAVRRVKGAGLRVMMVTGDHPLTARTIAAQAGILVPGEFDGVIEGAAYRAMRDAAARRALLPRLAVLARCSPTDKLLLVSDLQASGDIVSVTGDGTNDALALRKADVGLAMGIAGTDVAKDAADIIIMDDEFASIVATIRWGRSIKENIRKFLTFQLTINIVALTLTFVSACTSGGRNELPLKPVQLLWVNLIMDTFAALALATEPPSERLMRQKPQGKDESLMTNIMIKNMLGHAAFQIAVLLWMTQVPDSTAFFGMAKAEQGNTMHDTIVFTTFVLLQVRPSAGYGGPPRALRRRI